MNVFPELLAGRKDDFVPTGWTIEKGSARRGEANCNLTHRILRIPLGEASNERIVRTHELLHARVSPHQPAHAALPFDVHHRAAECAEEFRVNTLLHRLRFDTALLCDGSERQAGEQAARSQLWDETVCYLLAVWGTGGSKSFLTGVRSAQPTWVPPLRAIAKRADEIVQGASARELGSTVLTASGTPEGYERYTLAIARMASAAMRAQPPVGAEGLRQFRRSLLPGGRRAPTGVFAPLVLAEVGSTDARPRRQVIQRRRPQNVGVTVRYPQRFLTDPLRRIYGGKAKSAGGVVLIDQSGSMDVSETDLELLLHHAPDARILGYSHRPGDEGTTPNAWVLADHFGVVRTRPTGNVGNGVDGPALRWAHSLRRPGEPLVWVTDGQVTDGHDHPCDSLTVECAQFVLRNRVLLARTLVAVPERLRTGRSEVAEFGRLGRKLQEIAGSKRKV